MFNNLGWGEMAVLTLLGLLVFGPERLPKVAAQAGRLIRQLKEMATDVTSDLKREIGVDGMDSIDGLRTDLRDLNPRKWLSDDEAVSTQSKPLAPGEQPPYDPDAT